MSVIFWFYEQYTRELFQGTFCYSLKVMVPHIISILNLTLPTLEFSKKLHGLECVQEQY